MSVADLAESTPDQVVHAGEDTKEEAYLAVAEELGYIALGKASNEDVEAFRTDPGTVEARQWARHTWEKPPDETSSCWWVANAAEKDQTQEVKLICRSLTCLRLELQASRCATSGKLTKEWERRLYDNEAAVARLRQNRSLWDHIRGPCPEKLLRPSEADLIAAQSAAEALQRMVEQRTTEPHMQAFAEDIIGAVQEIKEVSWRKIHKDRFSLTPHALYGELVRTAESLLTRADAEAVRRQAFLAGSTISEEATDLSPTTRTVDKYGLDLDEFKDKSGKVPRGWNQAVTKASVVLLDEMRCLLEMHYDDVHLKRWRKRYAEKDRKAPERKGQYKVFARVADIHRKKLNQTLELPSSVKAILQCPEDELDWEKIERLRHEVCRIVEQRREVFFENAEEIEAVAKAIESCGSRGFHDEVGPDCKLPIGSRVELGLSTRSSIAVRRRRVASKVRALKENDALVVLLRPIGTKRQPPLDPFCRELFSKKSIRTIASESSLSIESTLDRMLLSLWDALFLAQCDGWSNDGVANMEAYETFELARYFILGSNVGQRPILDAICAQCGSLLHGMVNQGSALSNKTCGPPSDRDGRAIRNPDGSPMTDAQPPFLLRYSPALYAKEAPEIFIHEPMTNRLSLKPGVPAPWIRPFHPEVAAEDENKWLYCVPCRERYFPKKGERAQSHIPFRDKASQHHLKPTYRRGAPKEQVDIPEPEGEPSQLPSEVEEDGEEEAEEDDEEESAWVPDVPADVTRRPTLEEYQRKWDSLKAWHAREVPGPFSHSNLVPAPNRNFGTTVVAWLSGRL